MIFNPKVSIIIPVYNGKKYLKEAIDSALGQTYKNIEVIVVNDGSRDDGASEKIALSYGDKIRYFYKKNGWVSSALNLGIKNMAGEYFSWLSHDDVYFPDKIESQISFLAEQKDKNSIVYGDYDLIDEHSEVFASLAVRDFPANKFKIELLQSNPISGCTLLIHKSLFLKTGMFDEKIRTCQDYLMWFRLADYADFVHLKKPLVKSRVHREQVTEHFSDYMIGETEQMYSQEITNLFEKSPIEDSTVADMIDCATGLVRKYCFKSAMKVIKLSRRKPYTISSCLRLLGFMRVLLFHEAVLLKHKIWKEKKSPKKLLIITPAFYPLPGGLSEQSYLLAKEFAHKGYQVDVLTEQLNKNLCAREYSEGIEVYRIKNISNRNFLGLLKLAIALTLFLLKNRSKYSFCVIRTITSHSVIVGFLKYLKLINFKTFITAETGGKNDEICSISKMKLKKVIVFFLNKHEFVNSNNSDNLKHFQEIGVRKNKLTLIYNGIDISDYEGASYPKEINSFMFMSELNKEKGVKELLSAFQRLLKNFPDKKLYIGGFGKMQNYIEHFIVEKHLENNIVFDGLIAQEKKKEFFERSDCFVFPSYSEGFGLVTAEAIRHKRLLITTKVADLAQIYGENVLYCQIKNIDSLYQTMVRSIEEYNWKRMNYDQVITKVDIKTTVNLIEGLFT